MKRTTIFADEGLLKEVRELSREENRSVAEIIRDAMEHYVKQRRRKKLSFIGMGDSGRRDVAENHEELLWKESSK